MIRTLDPAARAAIAAADDRRTAADSAAAVARADFAALILDLRHGGVTYAAVAAVVGVSPQRIHQIVTAARP